MADELSCGLPRRSNLDIRPATHADIPGNANVLVDTWQSTFRGLLAGDYLDSMSEPQQIERYQKRLKKPQVCCFVAVDAAGQVVGFCCGGPNRSPALDVSAEIYALYLRQAKQGLGVGRRLLNVVARQTHSSVGSGLVVWVIDLNPSRPFYEHMGGSEIARATLALGRDTVTQIAYGWLMR